MGEHRVRSLSPSLRRYDDPARSSDPRVRELVARLATLEAAPEPRAHFRAELRAQLVAVTPRLVAEGPAESLRTRPAAEAPVQISAAERLRGITGRLAHVPVRRPLGIVVGVFAVFAMLLGGAVLVSKKAVPGDPLYSLKRANENVQLSMTHGTERAKTYLSFASTRADEVQTLLSHASSLAAGPGANATAAVNEHTASLIASTLGSADDDVRNAAVLLGNQAVNNQSTDPLSVMTAWGPGQVTELQAIANRIPAGSLHDRAAASTQLVIAALARAINLGSVVDSPCMRVAKSDALGPIPTTVCALPALPAPTSPGVLPGTSGTSRQKNGPSTGATSTTADGTSGSDSTGALLTPSNPVSIPTLPLPTSGIGLPTLPIPSVPTNIIGTNSCGVTVSLGPIQVTLGACPPSSSTN